MNVTITALLLLSFIMMVKTQSLQVDEELRQNVELLSRHLVAMKRELAEMKAREEDSRQVMAAMKQELAEMKAGEEDSRQPMVAMKREQDEMKEREEDSKHLLDMERKLAEMKDREEDSRQEMVAMKRELAEMKAGEEDSRQPMVAMKRELAEMKVSEGDSKHLVAMERKLAEMKAREEDSRQEMAAMKREMVEMKKCEEASKQEISDLKLQVHNSNGLLKTLNYQVAKLQNKNSQLQFPNRQKNPFVGFTAYPTATRSYDTDQTILFDAIHTNYGEGYNAQLSVFQCPITGYYMFSINVHTLTSRNLKPEIYIDREEQTTFPRTYSDHGDSDNSSTMVITYCEVGDLVWVRNTENNDEMYGDTDDPLSSFSGALLAATA